MKDLPESKKRVFRVLKFLNTNIYYDNIINGECSNKVLDKQTRLHLYGYKPRFPSYHLRVFFLYLLLYVHGTPAEEELSDGRLLLCLIDMLQCLDRVDVYHPLIQVQPLYIYTEHLLLKEKFPSILAKMQSFTGEVSLLNSENQDWLESPDDDEHSISGTLMSENTDINSENHIISTSEMEEGTSAYHMEITSRSLIQTVISLICYYCQRR